MIALHQREGMVDTLSALLSNVQEEVHELKYATLRHQNWERPAVGLPSEILAVIFRSACFSSNVRPDQRSPEEAFGAALRQTRGAICSTCSRWRSVAIEDSLLWTNIVMAYRRQYSKSVMRLPHPAFIPIEISRAGARALAFYLKFYSGSDWEKISPVVSNALPATERLHVDVTFGAVIGILSHAAKLRRMHSLVIKWSGSGVTNLPANEPEIIDLTQSMLLRDLWVSWTHESRVLTLQTPEVCHITRLHLEGISSQTCVRLINSCPHLETLHWESTRRSSPGRMPQLKPQVHLKSLSVEGGLPFTSIGDMIAPSLIRLKIIHTFHTSDPVWKSRGSSTHVFADAARYEHLRYLDISGSVPRDVLSSFIVAHSKLEGLVLDFPLDAYWLDVLGRSSSSGFQLANLRYLWMRGTQEDGDVYPMGNVQKLLSLRRMSSNGKPFEMYLFGGDLTSDPDAVRLASRQHKDQIVLKLSNTEHVDPVWRWGERVL